MKPTTKGFTLVELLVVIAIIAVLAGLGFSGARFAIERARKVSAQATATSIVSSIESFYSDYSALPGPGTSDATVLDTDSAAGLAVMNILAGQETGTDIENTRRVRYLSVKEAKGNRDGATYGAGDAMTGLFDPWGQPYFFQLDYDYDERLQVATPITAPATFNALLRGKRAAVWSLGVENRSEASSTSVAKSW